MEIMQFACMISSTKIVRIIAKWGTLPKDNWKRASKRKIKLKTVLSITLINGSLPTWFLSS